MKTTKLVILILSGCLLLSACSQMPEKEKLESKLNTTPTPSANYSSNSNSNQFDNQMSVDELSKTLAELKDIEREARQMVALRNDWERGVAECTRIAQRLKPRARAVQSESKRMMLSLAGMEMAGASGLLAVCINCIENDDDTDCALARESIIKAEKELKKELRKK